MESINILESILQAYGLEKKDSRQIPALTLAYLGDAVYEVIIRSKLVEQGMMHVSDLNKAAVGYVRAGAQAELIQRVLPELTEEELAVFHRGRNAKSASIAKNASVSEYRNATGFEALIGFLYLEGKWDRILELTGEKHKQ